MAELKGLRVSPLRGTAISETIPLIFTYSTCQKMTMVLHMVIGPLEAYDSLISSTNGKA